jgi:hypothetical protein
LLLFARDNFRLVDQDPDAVDRLPVVVQDALPAIRAENDGPGDAINEWNDADRVSVHGEPIISNARIDCEKKKTVSVFLLTQRSWLPYAQVFQRRVSS